MMEIFIYQGYKVNIFCLSKKFEKFEENFIINKIDTRVIWSSISMLLKTLKLCLSSKYKNLF